MSKAGSPRWRYIAFCMHGQALGRRAVQDALTGLARQEGLADEGLPRLTRYEWPHGILQIDHRHARPVRGMLARAKWAVEDGRRVPLRMEPLSTSGTLKALTDRVGFLQERPPRGGKRARRGAPAKQGSTQARPRS